MELYIVRHGQTDWNKAKKMQGRVDMPLNDEGIAQARQVAEALKGMDFDAVYASPLIRARDTAAIIAGHNDIIIDERVYEIDLGGLEGLVYADLKEEETGLARKVQAFFMNPDEYTPTEGGESYESLLLRTRDFLEYLPKHHPGERVLLVSHATSIHAMVANMRNTPLHDLWKVPIMNGSITKAVYEQNKYKLIMIGETV